MPRDKRLHVRPHFFFSQLRQAFRRGDAAVVRARLIGTRFALDPFRLRMQRRETLRQRWSKNREGGHATHRRHMSWAGIVADEHSGMIEQRSEEQTSELQSRGL